jgi:NADH-quinone oxidoreductase subunit L
MRKMGGLRKKIPLTFWTMLFGALSMVGMIPFAGFWAKDEIVGATFVKGEYVVWAVAMVTVLLTAIYMGRLIFMTFWGETRADAEVQAHIHESPPIMTVPLVLLAIPATFLGLLVGVPPEGGWIHGFLEPVFFDVESEAFQWAGEGGVLMLASLATVIVGLLIAWWLYVRQTDAPGRIAERVPWAYRASLNKVYLDDIYAVVPVGATLGFAGWLWTFFDAKVIDGAVNGVAWLWGWVGDRLRPIQTGRVQNYAMYVFGGMIVLVVVLAWVWGS